MIKKLINLVETFLPILGDVELHRACDEKRENSTLRMALTCYAAEGIYYLAKYAGYAAMLDYV